MITSVLIYIQHQFIPRSIKLDLVSTIVITTDYQHAQAIILILHKVNIYFYHLFYLSMLASGLLMISLTDQ